MKYDAEFTITVKLSITMPKEHSPQELEDKIKMEGKKMVSNYLNNKLFDPEKKIIFEDSTINTTNYDKKTSTLF